MPQLSKEVAFAGAATTFYSGEITVDGTASPISISSKFLKQVVEKCRNADLQQREGVLSTPNNNNVKQGRLTFVLGN